MDEIKRRIIERGQQSILRIPERRRTYPGSTGRHFDRREFASPLDYERFLFTLGANEIPSFDSTDALSDAAIYLRPSSPHPSDSEEESPQRVSFPRGGRPVNQDDVWSTPYASLPRDQHTDETEQEDGQQEIQQEENAATPSVAALQHEATLGSAFRALQLPSGVSQLPDSSGIVDDSDRQTSVPREAHPTDTGDILSQTSSSLLQNLRNEKEGREQERKQEEKEEATMPPATVTQPQITLSGVFRALQLPSEISQADFIHLAVQFVFENSPNVSLFRYANDSEYDEAALARYFSTFSMAIWGDGAPEGDGATQWLARLTQFFAILRTGSYIRGGTHATPRELLIRLVGVERVEGTWTDHPMNPVETEVADAYRDLYLTRGGVGRLQEFIDLAAAHAFEHYVRLDHESADLQGFGDIYDPRDLAGTFLTSFRIALWEGIADDESVFATRIADLERFFVALWNRNHMRRDAGTSREILVRLIGADAIEMLPGYLSDATPNERRDSTGNTNAAERTDVAASNPILSPLFLRLDISESEDEPRDSYLTNTFQNVVTHLAFEVINARRREPLTSFGANIRQIDPRVITRIITRLRKR